VQPTVACFGVGFDNGVPLAVVLTAAAGRRRLSMTLMRYSKTRPAASSSKLRTIGAPLMIVR
jgi:hypothetical protein